MNERVVQAASDIIKVIKDALDPSSNNNQRCQAYQVHEEFKRTSPLCSEVGFYIFDKELKLDTSLRLCGLQLVEWFILNNWDKIDVNWRNNMKYKCLQLIETAEYDEDKCIKEAVVKIIVDVIKRSWPQEWVSLFSDLSKLHKQGDAQLELVLIVLMRLSEDINPLNGLDDKVKQQRRKDMVSTLNTEISNLFKFFFCIIHDRSFKLTGNDAKQQLDIITAALYTIAEYATWVNFTYLIAEEKLLFKVLFYLLQSEPLKLIAVHCLCSVFGRKTEAEKRIELMVILSDDALDVIEKVASESASKASLGNADEYRFLKQVSEMVASFGINQIASLWGDDRGIKERPKCFDRYLKMMLELSKHESAVIALCGLKVWQAFCNHPHISNDDMFLAAIRLLPEDLLRIMSVRLSDPQYTKNPGSLYMSMDFDEGEEFKATCNESRAKVHLILQKLVSVDPHLVLQFVMEKAKLYLSEVPDLKDVTLDKIPSTTNFILFESFLSFCRDFFSTFIQKGLDIITHEGLCLTNAFLRCLIDYPCHHPIYMKHIIHTMESLFSVFVYSQDLMALSIQKLSSLMCLPTEQYEARSQYKVRRYSVGILSSLLKKNAQLLVDNFDDLRSFFNEKVSEDIFSNFEKASLIEGLLCVSKSLPDSGKMKAYVDEVFRYPITISNRDDVKEALSNTSSFINFLSLDNDCVLEPAILRRRELFMALETLQSAVRTLNVEERVNDNPTDSDIALFVSSHPGFQLLIDALPFLFDVAKQACCLWMEVGGRSQIFKESLMPYFVEVEHPGSKKEPVEDDNDDENHLKKQNKQFLVYNLHEVTFNTISLYGRCLGPVFFSLPGMMDAFIEKVARNWVHLPNYRMRKIWKAIVKCFSYQCPARYYETVLSPFLTIAIQQVFERFSNEWPRIKEMEEAQKSITDSDEEDDQSPEIIERRIMYTLSKEVFSILIGICTFRGDRTKPHLNVKEGTVLGKLGEFLFTNENTNLRLVTFIFSALAWPDSAVIDQVCCMITTVVRKIFVPERPVSQDIPNQIMMQLLQGLQVHGSDATVANYLINTSMYVYFHLREEYPGIVHIMTMVPTCTEEELKKFDLAMFVSETKFNDTTKRKKFQKLVQGAVGKTISEMYKGDLQIQDLVPLAPRPKPPKPDIIADGDDAGICQLFSPTQV